MKRQLKVAAVGLAGSSIVVASGLAAVSADTPTATSGDVGSSGISRTIFKKDRQEAKLQVSKAGLTKKAYAAALKAQLTKDLEASGYSQSQITIALQKKELNRLHHHKLAADKKSSPSTN